MSFENKGKTMDDEEELEEGEEGAEEEESSGSGFSFSSPNMTGFVRYLGHLLLACSVMGLYVVGTRYELGGSLKDTYRVNKITGDVEIVSGGGAATGTYRRGVYFFRPDQLESLKKKAVKQKRDLNEVVREAVDAYLEDQKK
ncbi:MAG: hypothetical protein HOI23_08975 [Deltaproteobacteria bacterium]|nr:hypothetical protein [Deltaproteobacteria bacterium]